MIGRILLGAALATAPAARTSDAPLRLGPKDAPIATSVAVPERSILIFVSGQVPDVADGKAAIGSPARYGDTATQARSVLGKIEKALAAQGLGLGDVVMLRVFLVAPPGRREMDFSGMMQSYRERFGTAAQPHKPARTTVQVAGLYDPAFLVEIEAIAAK